VLGILMRELPLKQAVSLAVQITGAKKNAVYGLALKLADNSERTPDGSDQS
jgi:16S rRNA (cytidine1402-2'-O)-methyltransferase